MDVVTWTCRRGRRIRAAPVLLAVVALAACGRETAEECTVEGPDEFVTQPPRWAHVGREYTYAPNAVFSEFAAPVYYDLVDGPPGATLSFGTLSWTPGAAGRSMFAVRATVDGFTVFGEYRRSVEQRWCVEALTAPGEDWSPPPSAPDDGKVTLLVEPTTVRAGEPVTATATFPDGTAKLWPWQLVLESGVPVQVTPAAGRTDVTLEVTRADGHTVLRMAVIIAL